MKRDYIYDYLIYKLRESYKISFQIVLIYIDTSSFYILTLLFLSFVRFVK